MRMPHLRIGSRPVTGEIAEIDIPGKTGLGFKHQLAAPLRDPAVADALEVIQMQGILLAVGIWIKTKEPFIFAVAPFPLPVFVNCPSSR